MGEKKKEEEQVVISLGEEKFSRLLIGAEFSSLVSSQIAMSEKAQVAAETALASAAVPIRETMEIVSRLTTATHSLNTAVTSASQQYLGLVDVVGGVIRVTNPVIDQLKREQVTVSKYIENISSALTA